MKIEHIKPATIIKGGYLLEPDGLRKDWGVRVEEEIITCVGPNQQLIVNDGDRVIAAPERLIAPGFINGHTHMYGVLSHGITMEAKVSEFSSFLEDFWWPLVENRLDHELVEKTARWGCLEMIRSGITTFLDVLEGPNSIPGALEVEAGVVRETGLRAILTFEACQRISRENGELGLKENAYFVRRYNHPGNMIQGLISVHTLFTADREYLLQAGKLADELGCDIHMHLSESVFEPNWSLKKYGRRPVVVYDELNFLGPNVLASQGVQLNPNEIDILARSGVRMVHMPLSNCEVGGGIAPVPELLAKGIQVGLGTDGYINNFFDVMRTAFLLQKAKHQDPMIMPAADVYAMGTTMGARAIGRKDLGQLEPGSKADLITINLDTPTPINSHNIYEQLILFRNPIDVIDLMVNGTFLMENRELLTIDEDKTRAEIREAAGRFWRR